MKFITRFASLVLFVGMAVMSVAAVADTITCRVVLTGGNSATVNCDGHADSNTTRCRLVGTNTVVCD